MYLFGYANLINSMHFLFNKITIGSKEISLVHDSNEEKENHLNGKWSSLPS